MIALAGTQGSDSVRAMASAGGVGLEPRDLGGGEENCT